MWNLYNARVNPGESIRVFPLSNWTELDVWHYIHLEKIPVVPLYFAQQRRMLVRGDSLIPVEQSFVQGLPGEVRASSACWRRSRLETPTAQGRSGLWLPTTLAGAAAPPAFLVFGRGVTFFKPQSHLP